MASGTPSRRACRRASPSPDDSHQAWPSRQARSSVRRPYRPGAEQKHTTDAPPATASSQGKSTPPSAHRVTPNRAAPSWNTPGVPPGPVALFALAQVALAVDAAEPAVVAVQLGDVERPPSRSAMPNSAATPVREVAASSARTGPASTGRARSGWARGATDPVSESSGNTASWQPWALACSSTARCRARLPPRSPFWASMAATRMRKRPLLSSDDRPAGVSGPA
jgi:hypothetical protein